MCLAWDRAFPLLKHQLLMEPSKQEYTSVKSKQSGPEVIKKIYAQRSLA